MSDEQIVANHKD